jgi:hypothetical protein
MAKFENMNYSGGRGLRLYGVCGLLCLGCILGVPAAALGAGDANEVACPAKTEASAGFRVGLPDCRAYELVSPAATNGEPLFEGEVSANGADVAFVSIGEFDEPGDDENANGALYVAARGEASGWVTSSVEPLASAFQEEFPDVGGENRGFSADMSKALFTLVPSGDIPADYRYYRRESSGEFAEIGPTVSAEKLATWTPSDGAPQILWVGASADLSHVFFTPRNDGELSSQWFWPGDPTVGEFSLYEYAGTGEREPELVGIKPGTPEEEAKDKPSERPKLISDCGTMLGGVEGGTVSVDTYNAVSSLPRTEEGRVVFFTARGNCGGIPAPVVNELYARVAGSRTVAISEPTTGPEGDCSACDDSDPAPAVFQGANEEGSKVFFVSTQELFDGSNGELAGKENLYEYDFDAKDSHERVSLVAPLLDGVMRVSEDGSRVDLVSQAVLSGAEANEYGAEPELGVNNLYVYDTETGKAQFVAQLSDLDGEEWRLLDVRPDVETTPEGRFLLFGSVNDVTSDASGTGRQLYLYDAAQTAQEASAKLPRLLRVSVGDVQSDDGNDGAASESPKAHYVVEKPMPVPAPVSLAVVGGQPEVFFESSGALTPQALNHACPFEATSCSEATQAENVYEYERGRVYLLSDGIDSNSLLRESAVRLIGASASGNDVYFYSDDALAGQPVEGTGEESIYDARVDGGLSVSLAPAGCTDECQVSTGGPAVAGEPSSMAFVGPGNAAVSSAGVPGKPETAAAKLAGALKGCRARRVRRRRVACEASARRRYGRAASRASADGASRGRRKSEG